MGRRVKQEDYRQLRFSNITSPRYSHLLLLLGWVVYFSLYFITESLIPPEVCYVVYSPLDDLIPFCEVFVIPYVFWYFLLFTSLGYFLFYKVESFKKLQIFIMITQGAAMLIYVLFPNRQDLRPAAFPRENVFTWIIGNLYAFDTSTNVCPSLHVAYSIGIASIWLKEKESPVWWRCFVLIAVILICLSTAFIKQHSVLDGFAAIPICMIAEILLFKDYYRRRFFRTK